MLGTAVLMAASMVVGQAEEPNVAYEQLKVLEGLIGEWEGAGLYDEDTLKWETKFAYSWVEGNKVIKGEVDSRYGAADEDTSKKEFSRERCVYFVWNAKDEQIDQYQIRLSRGRATVHVWERKEDGVFSVRPVWPLPDPERSGDTTATITRKTITMITTKRTNKDGEALKDVVVKFRKVER
jgi:hypothetical protein